MIRRLLCFFGIHHVVKDHTCYGWEPATDYFDRWRCCTVCGKRVEYIDIP